MATTKKPTGLTVSRGMASSKDNGVNDMVLFKCEWKQAEDYEAQNVWYRKYINHNSSGAKANDWTKKNSGIGDATSTEGMFYSSDDTAHMNEGHPYLYTTNYFPYKNQTIEAFQYVVRGKAEDKDVSDWTWCRYNINLPPEPVVTNELVSNGVGGGEYTTNFSWSVDANDDDSRIFERYEWQSMLIKACKEFDGSKLSWDSSQIGWKTGHGDPGETEGQIDNTASGGSRRGISESSGNIETSPYSATRWFRVRSVGCRGASKWVYSYHTYAVPNTPTITSASYKVNSSNNTMDVTVSWKVDQSGGLRPIDAVEVDYLVAVPQTLAFGLPENPSWEGANISKDGAGTDTAFFRLNRTLARDECLFVRVLVSHDSNAAYSTPKVLSPYGYLKDPSIGSITVNQDYGTASVSYTNNSTDPNTRIAVVITGKDIDTDTEVSKKLSSTKAIYGIVSPTYDSDGNVLTQIPSSGTINVQVKPSLMEKIVSGSYSFGVVAFTAKDSTIVTSATTWTEDGESGTEIRYTAKSFIRSSRNIVYENGGIPMPPGNVTVERSEEEGEVIVRWEWNRVENNTVVPYYEEADSVVISWADNEYAWESTSQPETYTVSRSQPSRWRISDLETGKVWWFRVAFAVYTSDDNYTMGPWCEPVAFDLTTYPNLPVITGLSKSVVTLNSVSSGKTPGIVVTWSYSDPQNLPQAYYDICTVTMDENGDPVYNENNIIKHGNTANTKAELKQNDLARISTSAGIFYIAVRVGSSRGLMCEGWSKPVALTFAPALIFARNGVQVTEAIQIGSRWSLKSIPFQITVNTMSTCAACYVSIVREDEFHVDRPDGSEKDGYSGEIVCSMTKVENAKQYVFVVTKEDLIGYLDDYASYKLIVAVADEYGQVIDNSTKNQFIFSVNWTDKALSPTNSVFRCERSRNDRLITFIQPKQRDGITVGYRTNSYNDDTELDRVCDIYRITADGYQLIIENAPYNTTHIDPYPAFGKECGYRFVDKRYNGSYFSLNGMAWYDVYNDESNALYGNGYDLEPKSVVINYGKDIVYLPYNITLSNSWKKDFKQTKYLGGSIQGDWNPAVEMTSDISSAVFVTEDFETTRRMRELGSYPGICHVRTPEGASFAADVQVSDSKAWDNSKRDLVEFTITVTRVDSVDLEGVTYFDYFNNGDEV